MRTIRSARQLISVFLLFCVTLCAVPFTQGSLAHAQSSELNSQELQKLFTDGHYEKAYQGYRKRLLSPHLKNIHYSSELNNAATSLNQLGRVDEVDAFYEEVLAAHQPSPNWQLLRALAHRYSSESHYGYIVAGKFYRGGRRSGGKHVSSQKRDRVRALQLFWQGMSTVKKQGKPYEISGYYQQFAHALRNSLGYRQDWLLQHLTDLTKLPDYEKNAYAYGYGTKGTPVTPDGTPLYYQLPKSFADAKNDGERYRWLLEEGVRINPKASSQLKWMFANFLADQFGIKTLANHGYYWGRIHPVRDKKDESGTYALHTLEDNETITRFTTGIKRFTLPDEFNFIKMLTELKSSQRTSSSSSYAESALEKLAHIYQDRRQYTKAAKMWHELIQKFGPGHKQYRQEALNQVVGAWGRIEPGHDQAAGTNATFDYRFRNGKSVTFTAHRIKVSKLLKDIRSYLTSNPKDIAWDKINIQQIGQQLVDSKRQQYLGRRVGRWTERLEPLKGHYDRRVNIKSPLKDSGAYLIRAKIAGGNESAAVVWLTDTILVEKPVDNGALFIAVDAATGEPIPNASVKFFGYDTEHVKQSSNIIKELIGRRYNVLTKMFEKQTDKNGMLEIDNTEKNNRYQWLVSIENDERLAVLGFTRFWFNHHRPQSYNQTKAFTMTDRPVYRPGQKVYFKTWIRQAAYELEESGNLSAQKIGISIRNPRSENVFSGDFLTDKFAGVSGEFVLPEDAVLGVYNLDVASSGRSVTFRVEEYKKPEFEVNIDAPKEPVQLGDTFSATIKAKYYFGAPVTKAKVKYKILRASHTHNWYPPDPWDWFYGPGYWWFAYDYEWYPGWWRWGCIKPIPWWWHQPVEQPELIQENEVEIGPDGVVKVEIDSSLAKELQGDSDHRYTITAEVTDQSRRTIVGVGSVFAAREAFKVFSWMDRGYYLQGDTVTAHFSAQSIDQKPIQGKGNLTLYKTSYTTKGAAKESRVQSWPLHTNEEGLADLQIRAASAGQYRLSYLLRDKQGREAEGGYVFTVRGAGDDTRGYRFSDLELIPDKRNYSPGERVKLAVNSDHNNAKVYLFLRPIDGVYKKPTLIALRGKSSIEDIAITKSDMPNFFVEALTVNRGKVFSEIKEIVVPPEKRVLNVEVLPSKEEYRPGEEAEVEVRLTDFFGKPFIGGLVLSVYDKSVEYISGGSNVPDIKEYFWKWRRSHRIHSLKSIEENRPSLVPAGQKKMKHIGLFGQTAVDEKVSALGGRKDGRVLAQRLEKSESFAMGGTLESDLAEGIADKAQLVDRVGSATAEVAATVRTKFADTAYWNANVVADARGIASVKFKMPENLTGWKIATWAMGEGTRVGQGFTEAVTKKNLLLRMQAPRFFVEKDEVVLSANIHNYLKNEKSVRAKLELGGETLLLLGDAENRVKIEANGEARVNWRVKVLREGEAVVRMFALSDEESDAMEMKFPVYVHGMLKTESFSGALRSEETQATLNFSVPKERRPEESEVEVRYSPSLAGALVDALPYLASYPYGCTEQTLSRFLPTVITQKILTEMGLNLKAIKEKRTNLNAQEIGDAGKRAAQWKQPGWSDTPVFDEKTVASMVKDGVQRLESMQLSDGGWGWFSGYGEHSHAHTTAHVVHGLQIAAQNGLTIDAGLTQRGLDWLSSYQATQLQSLKNAKTETNPWKNQADDLDALVFMVLVDADIVDAEMKDFLYRDRVQLAVYGKSMLALSLHKLGEVARVVELRKLIEQYLVEDNENQTAYLRLPNSNYWWYWYGSEYEAHSYYLKLLTRIEPQGRIASRLVKYLLNNRKNGTYWTSTRDTAVVIEAMADYLRASGEALPDIHVSILVDGKKKKEVRITKDNLFSFDNSLVLSGKEISDGAHTIEFQKRGKGPLYFNAYVTNFTLEDYIKRAGLEVKVNRNYYKLTRRDATALAQGARGQALEQKVEKYQRHELIDLSELGSGDLVEVELEIDSKNDYEYVIFEDMKPAGFEATGVRSGYNGNEINAYVEYRDNRVAFFVRQLARGKHSVTYRMRAEIPGKFSALPTRAYAMYAPEIRGNSDGMKLFVRD